MADRPLPEIMPRARARDDTTLCSKPHPLQMLQPVGQWPPVDDAHVPLVQTQVFFAQHPTTLPFTAQHVPGSQHFEFVPEPQVFFPPCRSCFEQSFALRG